MPVILVLKGQRQEDCFKSEPSLVYVIYIASYRPAGLHGENLFCPLTKQVKNNPRQQVERKIICFAFKGGKLEKPFLKLGCLSWSVDH